MEKTDQLLRKKSFCLECSVDNVLISDKTINEEFILFIKDILRSSILQMAKTLSEVKFNYSKKCL